MNDTFFFSAPQLKRDPLGSVRTNHQLSITHRLFRGLVMAFVGGALALLIALRCAFFAYWSEKIRIPLFIVVRAAVGGGLGFVLTDYGWKRILRVLLLGAIR